MESMASTLTAGKTVTPLIPIRPTQIDGAQVNAVNARDLHQFMEVGKHFGSWIADRIQQFDFIEHRDFEVLPEIGNNPLGGRPAKEYALTMDMAKELAMVERNEKGKQARAYFIECERRVLTSVQPANPAKLSRLQLIQLAMDAESERLTLACENEMLKPKAAFHDQVHGSADTVSVSDFAKALGTGLTRMFRWLRKAGYVMQSSNLPYQKFIDQNLFRVTEQAHQDRHGRDRIFMKLLITGKGQTVLAKAYRAQGEPQKLAGMGR